MSLLMEALRKAEQAKSKVVKKEKDNNGADKAQTGDAEIVSAQNTEKNQADDSSRSTLQNTELRPQNTEPVVINPDPDEVETLANHSPDDELGKADLESVLPANEPDRMQDQPLTDELTLVDQSEDDSDGVDFTLADSEPVPSKAQPPGEAHKSDNDGKAEAEEQSDDLLSILESSYFTRTRKSGSSAFDDDDLDPLNTQNENLAVDEPETEPQAVSIQPQETIAQASPSRNEEDDAPATASASARKSREEKNRSSAGSLFLAKEDTQKRRLRKTLSIAAVLIVIPVAGITFWLYTSLTSTPRMQFNVAANPDLTNRGFLGENPPGSANNTLAQPQEIQANVILETSGSDAENTPAQATGQLTAEQATQGPGTAELPVVSPPVAALAPDLEQTNEPPAPQGRQTLTSNDTSATAVVAATPPQATEGPAGLSFVRTDRAPVINPDLSAAYDNYQQGDYSAASRLYQQVLASEPNNRDAMLGLASVNLKQNNVSMSQNLYARLLELNPRDPVARAGLLDTSMQDDPLRQETELKSLVSAYPDVPLLSFALGNLYASQSRWNESQNAYFNALLKAKSSSTGAVSPDYAFNLAVSLERLNQLRSALEYYREAEEYTRFSAPGFDRGLLDQRIRYLEQQSP